VPVVATTATPPVSARDLPLVRRRRRNRTVESRPAYVAPTKYIPHSTLDLWRSARPGLDR
jgi:hypothetical protein